MIVIPYWFWGIGWLLAGLIAGIATMAITISAPRLVSSRPPSPARLRLSMVTTIITIIAISIGLLWLVITLLGYYTSLTMIALLVLFFGLVQWLISPWIINAVYNVYPAGQELYWLKREVEKLSSAAGLRNPPKLVVADMNAPNAFAYGSPLAGYYVAVTRGLITRLPRDEVVAVIGHELGHLKHKDVQVMLALGLIPSIAYYLGILLTQYGLFSDGRRERDTSPLVLLAIGIVLVAVSVILHFFIRHLSRLREYYADLHSALLLQRAKPLQRALARIYVEYKRSPRFVEEYERNRMASMLFIITPLIELTGGFFYSIDSIVEELKKEKPNPVEEILSTHPPIQKRLLFLDVIEASLSTLSS